MMGAPWEVDDTAPWSVDDTTPKTNTLWEEAKRQAGLTARTAANVVASPLTLGGNILGKAVNAIAGKQVFQPSTETLDAYLTKAGLPEAQRPAEKFTQLAARSAPAFLLPATAGAQIAGNAAIGAADSPVGEELSGAALGGAGGAAMPVLGGALRLLGHGAANVLGATTGAGSESIHQAFKGGTGLVENMRGRADPADVVMRARQGLQGMRDQMNNAYRQNKEVWSAGQQQMDFTPIEAAFTKLEDSTRHAGMSKLSPSDDRILGQIRSTLDEWKANPAAQTTEGFDALKQRIRNIYPESPEHTQSRRIIETMAGTVRNEVAKQNPAYADAMKAHSIKMDQLDEIERSLALGGKNTIDTALRRLQSVNKNNATLGNSQRLRSAGVLSDEGGQDILPAIAGQELEAWMPRGIRTSLGAVSTAANPAAAVLLPGFSPRVVGEAAHALGQVNDTRVTRAMIEALRRTTPTNIRNLGEE